MFSKLLKHEWKANAGLLGILSLCALGVGLLGAGVLRAMEYVSQHMLTDQMAAIATSGLGSIMVFVVIALVAYALAVQFITLWRFYKNKFTDEGYLTFTLPVTCSQHIISKLILCSVTFTATTLVVLLNIFIMLFIGLGPQFPWAEIRTFVSDFLTNIQYQLGDFWIVYALEFLLFCILSTVLSCLFVFCCITIASIIAKKAKILTAVIIYYVLNGVFSFAVQIINLFGISTLSNRIYNFSPMLKNVTISLAAFGVLLVLALLCVLLYTFEHWLLDRKLNLA